MKVALLFVLLCSHVVWVFWIVRRLELGQRVGISEIVASLLVGAFSAIFFWLN